MALLNCFACSIIFLFFSLAFMAIVFAYVKFSQLELTKNQTILNTIIDVEKIEKNLNDIVDTSFTDYLLINTIPEDVDYIRSEKELEMVTSISTAVIGRITEYMIAKLSLIYKIESIEDLSDIITNKVYIKVMAYVVDINSINTRNGNNNKKEEPKE